MSVAAESEGRDVQELTERVLAGERRALARAITLVESVLPADRAKAVALIGRLAGHGANAVRVGLTGAPGVGKSTFIESFGQYLTGIGKRVAVLAVDPSSTQTGGSILGDKTRMERLARDQNAFIRPSPSGATLGGVARRTAETARLCEAAGYDVVLIETVGVGQSEIMVADLTDVFVLLIAPAGGDELQGVKRGVMEVADLLLATKADGALEGTARATASDYAGALRLLRKRAYDPEDAPSAMAVSAVTGAGIPEAWARMAALDQWRRESGWRDRRRADQAERRLKSEIEARLWEAFRASPAAMERLGALQSDVRAGRLDAAAAAEQAVAAFLKS